MKKIETKITELVFFQYSRCLLSLQLYTPVKSFLIWDSIDEIVNSN